MTPVSNGPQPLSEALGVWFWLAVMWLAVTVLFAVTAEFWPLPAYDHMDWEHPAAPPGTVMPLKSQSDQEEMKGADGVYLL